VFQILLQAALRVAVCHIAGMADGSEDGIMAYDTAAPEFDPGSEEMHRATRDTTPDRKAARPTQPRSPPRARRPHALFPRPPDTRPEDWDIRWVGIMRKLPPAAAKPLGRHTEHSPHDYPANELPDWAEIHDRFGGGAYMLCAKDSNHRILCWVGAPGGEDKWYYMCGRSKPLSDEDDEDVAVPQRASAAPAAPAGSPAMDVGTLIQMQIDAAGRLIQMQIEVAERQSQMQFEATERLMSLMARMSEDRTTLVLAILNRRKQDEAAARGAPDLFEAVRLGVEIGRAQQATAATAPPTDPFALLRGTIALVKEIRALTPAPARSASDVAEMQTMLSDLVTKLKAGSTTDAAASAQDSQQLAPAVIDGPPLSGCATAAPGGPPLAAVTAAATAEGLGLPLPLVPAVPCPPVAAASLHDGGDAVCAAARASAAFVASLTLLASQSRLRAEQTPAGTLEAPPYGGAPSSSEPAAVSACDSLVAINSGGTSTALSGVDDEPRASSRVARRAPAPSSDGAATQSVGHSSIAAPAIHVRQSIRSTEQPLREGPQHPPTASPAPADGPDDQAAVDQFLHCNPAARRWLRAAVETDARAPLRKQPADLGYFAQAIEIIRESSAGRAMLRAVVTRAEAPRPTPSVSTHDATRPAPPTGALQGASRRHEARPHRAPLRQTHFREPDVSAGHVHETKKVIADRLGLGVKQLTRLMAGEEPPLVEWCRARQKWLGTESPRAGPR
jgi:hypothetical protein